MREQLLKALETHYRESGWRVRRQDDSTVFADGPGGVTWIGTAVVPEDLRREDIEERLRALAEKRMEGSGELCPFELLPSADCQDELRELLSRIGISERSNVAIYSFAA